MEKFIRLRDLENVSSENVDVPKIISKAYGFKYKNFLSYFKMRKLISKVNGHINKVRATDVSKIAFKECNIKKPDNIEKITYSAMMNLSGLLSKKENVSLSELIAEIISTSCYSANIEKDFDTETNSYRHFKNRVLDSNILEMFGIYNWIIESFEKSNDSWEERFFSVEVEDPDYDLAGGQRMAQFNVLNTLKKICNDFNRNDKEAWQMPFYMVQMNNYESASSSFTRHQMSTLKEVKMRAERDKQNG